MSNRLYSNPERTIKRAFGAFFAFWCLWVLTCAAALVGLALVAIHFISKYW